VRRRATVLHARWVGPYRELTVADDGLARPGQFYMLAAVERWGGGDGERPFLPRAFSFLRHHGDRVSFLWEDVGPGTVRLSELTAGDELWLLGPLGNGFSPGPAPLHVGGGIGIVPLAGWQDAVGGEALLGFRDAHHAEAGALLADVTLATDDGSAGHHGLVTELLVDRLDTDAAHTVFACGPEPMLEAVRDICVARGVPAQLALESGMACGFGACFGCVVPTTDGYVRLCVDGPVLEAEVLTPAAGRLTRSR
jgi:dihydroorotate dehydrogenase electron transfer subunit